MCSTESSMGQTIKLVRENITNIYFKAFKEHSLFSEARRNIGFFLQAVLKDILCAEGTIRAYCSKERLS